MPDRGLTMHDLDFWGWLSWLGHALSPVAIFGSLIGFFPGIAAAVALIFYFIQIYESATVQTWMHTRRLRKIAEFKKHIAALEAQELKGLARRIELVKKTKAAIETLAANTKTPGIDAEEK